MRKVLFLFGQLGDEDVAWLRCNGAVQALAPGEVLITEGEPVDAVFIVLQGSLAVTTRAAGSVAQVGAGEILGEMSFVDSRPPSATVRAAGRAVVLGVGKAALSRHLDSHPAFAARFYRALALFLSDRLRGAESGAEAGEIDFQVLEQVTQAGARFDEMVRTLIQAPVG